MTTDDKTNTTGRSVHQSIKTLEDAAARFLEEFRAYAKRQEESKYSSALKSSDMYSMVGKLRAALVAHTGEAKEVPRKKYNQKRIEEREGSIEETHESYGLISINRGSSTGFRLFGSSIRHQNSFTLRITRGMRIAGDTGERFRTDGRVPIVEVMLTPAQFVEMVSTMNIGEGVPCTIAYVEGVAMDSVPEDAGSELKVMADVFAERVKETMATMHEREKLLGALLEKKTLTKADKDEVKGIIHGAVRLLDDSAPFILKVFGENVEKMAAKGKLEVESFIQLALQRMGIKAIHDAGGVLMLGTGEEESKKP